MSIRITDEMTTLAEGADARNDLLGRTVIAVHEVEDSDRGEVLLVLDNQRCILLSCDPGYDEQGIFRTETRWEVVLYDATATEAGKAALA